MPYVMERELIQIGHQWLCSRCGCKFYNAECVLTGLTLAEIMLRVRTMREQAFARHVCSAQEV
jgi:hypothetical protein